jgi:hypothetical protein
VQLIIFIVKCFQIWQSLMSRFILYLLVFSAPSIAKIGSWPEIQVGGQAICDWILIKDRSCSSHNQDSFLKPSRQHFLLWVKQKFLTIYVALLIFNNRALSEKRFQNYILGISVMSHQLKAIKIVQMCVIQYILNMKLQF